MGSRLICQAMKSLKLPVLTGLLGNIGNEVTGLILIEISTCRWEPGCRLLCTGCILGE